MELEIDPQVIALMCDACGFFPLEREHAHFRCPSCKNRTSCCEMPI